MGKRDGRQSAARETIELLEELPARLERPLALVDGRGYAATWLPVRVHREVEAVDRARRSALVGEARVVAEQAGPTEDATRGLVALPSRVESRLERRLYVVRDDGAVYGDGAGRPIEALGLEVAMPDPPRTERLWRLAGV